MTITTGSVKTQETYEAQYRRHENPNKEAQRATNEWHSDTNATDPVSQRDETGGGKRSGSDSNA